jgi:thiol-disulfide isomerase/thioredoxin
MNNNNNTPTSNTVYISLFLAAILIVAGGLFFVQQRWTLPDGKMSKILTAGWFTLVAIVIFVGFFWAFRGFPPGSRLVVAELPTENDLLANEATFMFFYTEWCPYSQDALPKVKSLSETVQGSTYGGKTVTVKLINCENEKSTCRTYGVSAYPTYKLITASKAYEYSGPPRTSTYEQFLVSALGSKTKSN